VHGNVSLRTLQAFRRSKFRRVAPQAYRLIRLSAPLFARISPISGRCAQPAPVYVLEKAFAQNFVLAGCTRTFGKRAKFVVVKQMGTVDLPTLPFFGIDPHADWGTRQGKNRFADPAINSLPGRRALAHLRVIARLPGGGWSGPSAIATGGAGFGFQVGGQVTEFVIILNTQAAVDAFARGGNVQFGGALSVAAGPVGRTAEAGVLPVAAVYTYSRSQGIFAGASLEGTILVAQAEKNARYYRRPVTPEQILRGRVVPPPSAAPLIAALRRY
jgi:Las17-binding protein actin regulator